LEQGAEEYLMEEELGEKVRKKRRRQDIRAERGRVEVAGEGIIKGS
jgi:hypothetical protein